MMNKERTWQTYRQTDNKLEKGKVDNFVYKREYSCPSSATKFTIWFDFNGILTTLLDYNEQLSELSMLYAFTAQVIATAFK